MKMDLVDIEQVSVYKHIIDKLLTFRGEGCGHLYVAKHDSTDVILA